MTLVILAAGMGSRYGGLKQLDPMTAHGEFIIDFSIFDAIRAGFDRVIFIIKRENYSLFKQTVGDRVSSHIKVEYAFQDLRDLPEGFSVPAGRSKPWGTTHALLSCAGLLDYDNFAVINADDFYGAESYEVIASHLRRADPAGTDWCMAGYILGNTLTDHGHVSRGVCVTSPSGSLLDIDERTKIYRRVDGAVVFLDGDAEKVTDPGAYVSLNFWGFTPRVMEYLDKSFTEFLKVSGGELRSECYIPVTVKEALADKFASVKVLPTPASWYGVTYIEDKPFVTEAIARLIAVGKYPDGLWAG
jgi:hypothetical protein